MDYESILKMVKQQNPEYSLLYKDILADIRNKDQKLPFKDAQKRASEKFKKLQSEVEKKAKDTFAKFEKARDELKSESLTKDVKTTEVKTKAAKTDVKAGEENAEKAKESPENNAVTRTLSEGIPVDDLFAAEERIRKIGPNRNTIIRIGSEVIPNGQLRIHGQEGPNKLVTWEDDEGNCIPISGYFKIFMV